MFGTLWSVLQCSADRRSPSFWETLAPTWLMHVYTHIHTHAHTHVPLPPMCLGWHHTHYILPLARCAVRTLSHERPPPRTRASHLGRPAHEVRARSRALTLRVRSHIGTHSPTHSIARSTPEHTHTHTHTHTQDGDGEFAAGRPRTHRRIARQRADRVHADVQCRGEVRRGAPPRR